MLVDRTIYISPSYAREEYLKLNLKADSPLETWERAISIFRDRIEGRFLNPIKDLIDYPSRNTNKVMVNGFAAMGLMCLLIDTFMQFKNGYPQSVLNSIENRMEYTDFMSTALRFDPVEAERFYDDIRCGILHSAETKNGSCLVPENTFPIETEFIEEGKTILKVSVPGMLRTLEMYYMSYCRELMAPKNLDCRRKFCTKMDDITMKHDAVVGDFDLWNGICKNAGKDFCDFKGYPFTYSTLGNQRTIIVKKFGWADIHIPFSDIKSFLYYSDINAQRRISYWFFIKSILEGCSDEVKHYIQCDVA